MLRQALFLRPTFLRPTIASRMATTDTRVEGAATFGALACQRDSYQRSLSGASVLQCTPSAAPDDAGCFDVVLSDTCLFPEGGGQPDDAGTVGGVPIVRMRRAQGTAVHVLPSALAPGSSVDVCVDWPRRADQMEQHSAQHLLTALAIGKWGHATESWNLGPADSNKSFLHLATPLKGFGPAQAAELEDLANAAIRAGAAMTPRWVEEGSAELAAIRCRGLPAGTVWPVRAVEIAGIDTNLCCGTHVQDIAHLGQIKVLGVEGVKQETRVWFAAGGRVLRLLGSYHRIAADVTKLLCAAPEAHAERVSAVTKAQKDAAREKKALLKELAELKAAALHAQLAAAAPNSTARCASLHRDAPAPEFMKLADKALKGVAGAALFVTAGSDKEGGQFSLAGPKEFVAKAGPEVAALLEGRGGGKATFQGKCASLKKRHEAQALVESIFAAMLVSDDGGGGAAAAAAE